MEAIVPNLNEICRLCLCEDIRFLIPASKLLDDSLSLQHIERFTGIRVSCCKHRFVVVLVPKCIVAYRLPFLF